MAFWSDLFLQRKSKIAKQTGLLFSAQMGVILLGFVTVPIVTRSLGPTSYGQYALVLAVITFAASFFEFGFFSAGARLLATSKSEKEEREILGSLYFVAIIIAALFSLTLWIASFYIDGWLTSDIGPILRIAAPLAGLFPVQFMIQQIAQGSNRIGRLAAVTILPGIWMLGAVLTLSHTGQVSVLNILVANMISLLLVSLVILFTFLPTWKGMRRSLGLLIEQTGSYGRDVYLGRVIGGSMFDLDKFFISRFVSAASVGYYALALLVISPMVILSQSFASTLFKGFASQDRVPAKVNLYNFVWLVGSASFLVLLGPTIIRLLFSDRFAPVSSLLPPLAVAGIFQGLYQPYNNFLGAHGQGRYLRNIALVFALFSAVFNFVLIRSYGASGAAFATLISNATYFVLCLYCYLLYLKQKSVASPTGTERKETVSKDFFEHLYEVDPEPWGLGSRASQKVRYQEYLKFLTPLLSKKQRVLDIGCSKGQFTNQLAPLVGETVGTDISELAIEQARATAAENTRYEVGSLPTIEFETSSFDAVLALEVLYYLTPTDQELALKEIARVMKPGGFALFSVNIGAKPYYQMDELGEFFGRHFQVEKIIPGHGRVYSFWQNKALILEPTFLGGGIRTLLGLPQPVRMAEWISRNLYGKKGITMASILVRTK